MVIYYLGKVTYVHLLGVIEAVIKSWVNGVFGGYFLRFFGVFVKK
jgi:hypothetical protein